MTSMTFGRRIKMRALGLGCVLVACIPATALAQAQSPACAKASFFHANHNVKEAARWDRLCKISSIKSGSGGAASQAAARDAHLAQTREAILAKQRVEAAQRPAQRPAQPSYQRYAPSPAQEGAGGLLQRMQENRARRRVLMQQQQQQQQQQSMPTQAPAPAFAAAPVPSAAPSPRDQVVPVSADSAPPPANLDAVLTPGLRDTSLVNDQTTAARAKTDMAVFGVALGGALTRPHCVRGTRLPDPCVAEGGLPTLTAAVFNERIAKLTGFSNVPLHLPDAQCPDWLKAGSCDVILAMSDGYVYAAFMAVGGEDTQAVVETQLSQKYGKKAEKGAPSQCKKDGSAPHPQAPLRSWTLHGLRVEYDPYGTSCASSGWRKGTGQLVVETDTFRRLVTEAGTPAQPKM
ncbi:MAG: hypothetical protein ABI488_12875 [Polyangiaceae bacterium]